MKVADEPIQSPVVRREVLESLDHDSRQNSAAVCDRHEDEIDGERKRKEDRYLDEDDRQIDALLCERIFQKDRQIDAFRKADQDVYVEFSNDS